MARRLFQVNSLRLNRLIGGGDHSHGIHAEWFYNGSIKFEDEGEGPRVFQTLSGAIKYFTKNTFECERVQGQYVTWAEKTTRNWVLYVFMGPDTSNASYSNPDNWWPFGEIRPDPYQSINEVLKADKEYREKPDAHYHIDEKLEVEQDN